MRPQTARTTAAGNSTPIMIDFYGWPTISLQLAVTGAATATVQQTLDNPNEVPAASINWVPHPDANMVGMAVGVKQSNYAFLPVAIRVVQVGTGTASLTVVQAGGARGS